MDGSHEVVDITPAEHLLAELLCCVYYPETRPWSVQSSEAVNAVLKGADLERVARQMHAYTVNCEQEKFHPSKDGKTMERTVDLRQEKRKRAFDRENYSLISEVRGHLEEFRLADLAGDPSVDSAKELHGHAGEYVPVPHAYSEG